MQTGRAWRVQTAGGLAGMTACGMIHILLVIAVVVILVRVISGRRIEPACGCPNKMSVQGVACWRVSWG